MGVAVLDTSVTIKWIPGAVSDDDDLRAATELLQRYQDGEFQVMVPPLHELEMVNVAARRWKWDEASLMGIAGVVADLSFDVTTPDLDAVAGWASEGLSAYDASFVALAEQVGAPLVTADRALVRKASGHAVLLGRF